MSECADLTYYQNTRDVILTRANNYYENDKEKLRGQARDKYLNFLKKKYKKENMGRIYIAICLKKKNKD